MNHQRTGHHSRKHQGGGSRSYKVTRLDLEIPLGSPTPEMYDTLAEQVAKQLAADCDEEKNGKNMNKPAQLRRFYDEIVMWEQRLRQNPESYSASLPLIRMLNAKVAYAQARDLVTGSYRDLFRKLLAQLDENSSVQTFQNLKLFLEAVMGFYKGLKS